MYGRTDTNNPPREKIASAWEQTLCHTASTKITIPQTAIIHQNVKSVGISFGQPRIKLAKSHSNMYFVEVTATEMKKINLHRRRPDSF